MRIQPLVSTFLLSSALVFAQSTPAPNDQVQRDPARSESGAAGQKDPVPNPQAAPAKKEVPPDAPVITIKGVCPAGTPASPDCQTVVTRAQFESLVNALNPEMPPETRERFAQNYGRLLVVASEARKAGVDKLPGTDQLYEFSNMQVLAQQFGKKLQEESAKVPDGDVETYYREHQKDYDIVQLERVIVPRHRQDAKSTTPAPTEAQEKAYAQKIRQRWIAGEDPTKLQQETYKHESLDAAPPVVAVGERRRNGLPETQQAVFDLKVGDVSEPFVDPAAFFIYKVTKRESKSLADVRDEIKKTLAAERLQKSMEKVTNAAQATLNPIYFAPAAPPAVNADREKKVVPNPVRPATPSSTTKPTTKPAVKPTQAPKTPPATPSK
jgi:bifunctional DNA-binding transcriptional regulator/antitoxin component of YhaV-PrlF toxin-antitoxin module